MSVAGKKIILGITGSIAAYKSAFLTRLLVKQGAEVQVIMTPEACDFISPLTLATLSKRKCLTSYVNSKGSDWNNHVELGLWADALLIAPATANTIAKMAHGICDNLLMGVFLSARCPVYLAPAMDEDMWKHDSTQENIGKLQERGSHIIPVNSGELASGLIGPGRMAEPEEIITYLSDVLSFPSASGLKGKRILITAGPTYEAIDPVRYIGNYSTGKMGIAIAEAAARRGAKVKLVLGPSALKPATSLVEVERVTSGSEMLEACRKEFDRSHVCIFSAAVADYAPASRAGQKIKKDDDTMQLDLVKTADIAAVFGKQKKAGQLSVGFALETEHEETYAREKLKKKNFDMIVLNSLNDAGAGFRHDTNKITIMDRHNNIERFELKSKELVASDILNKVEELL